MKYRAEVDGLRAVAVLPVIFFHAGLGLFSGGFVGVDIFFVISGYLITTILLKEIDEGSYSVIDFYERRIRRIIPALAFVCGLCILFSILWLSPTNLKGFFSSLVSVFVFISNLYFWKNSDYFDVASEFRPLIHTWSLSVEEQFYLFFPLALAFIYKFGKKTVISATLFLFVLSLVISHVLLLFAPSASYYLLPSRGWELLAGSLAAYFLFYNRREISAQLRNILSIAGLCLIFASIFLYSKSTPFPGIYALLPVAGSVLVIIFSDQQTLVGRLLSNRIMVKIGLISYSAYLFHQPVFVFSRIYISSKPEMAGMLGLSLLSLALGYLSWRFVEKPFRNKQLFSKKRIYIIFAFCSSLFLCLGILGRFGSDALYEYKYSDEQKKLFTTAQSSPKRNSCHTRGDDYVLPADACEYGGEKISWAVFGDSHVIEFGYALSQGLSKYGIGIKHLSYSMCIPYSPELSKPETGCQRWTNDAISFLGKHPEIDTVVVSFRINAHLFGLHEDYYPDLPDLVSQDDRSMIWKSYVSLLNNLLSTGKRVVLVLQAPELSRLMEDLIARNDLVHGKIVSVPRNWWDGRNSYVMSHLQDLPKGLLIVNPADLFCDTEFCYASQDGQSLYYDDDHMSISGGSYITEKILEIAPPY